MLPFVRNSLLSCLGFLSAAPACAGIVLDADVAQKLTSKPVYVPLVIMAPTGFGQAEVLNSSSGNFSIANYNASYGKRFSHGSGHLLRGAEASDMLRQSSVRTNIYRARSYRVAP